MKQWFLKLLEQVLFKWFGWRVMTTEEWQNVDAAVQELNRYYHASGYLSSTGKHIKRKLRRKIGNINRAIYRDVAGKYQPKQ